MSFSVTYIGKPDAIKRKLAEESDRMTGQSKVEFDAVKPALETILDQQVGNGVIHLSANGHAQFAKRRVNPEHVDGVSVKPEFEDAKTYGSCTVDVKSLGQIAE